MTRRALMALPAALPALAQNPKPASAPPVATAPANPPDEIIRVEVDLVNIFFSVRDKKGTLIPNLAQEDIEVYEDGVKQTLKSFARETDLPLTIGLLVDVSPSQEALIETERQAATSFFQTVLKTRDMAFVLSFGAEAELLQDLTSSPKILTQSLQGLKVNASAASVFNGGAIPGNARGTVLYDAVYLAANEKLRGEVGRKVMVLITDGVDSGSRVKLREAIDSAHMADAIAYSIYYFDPRAYGGYRNFGVSDTDLRKLSEDTGGRVFRVDRKLGLADIFRQIESELRTQYAISYSSSNPNKDGGFRKVEIRPKDKNLKAQARRGYFAGKS
jgi:VWFA-related protein